MLTEEQITKWAAEQYRHNSEHIEETAAINGATWANEQNTFEIRRLSATNEQLAHAAERRERVVARLEQGAKKWGSVVAGLEAEVQELVNILASIRDADIRQKIETGESFFLPSEIRVRVHDTLEKYSK